MIRGIWQENKPLFEEIGGTASGVYTIENRFFVGLVDASEKNIACFREAIMDDERIIFEETGPIVL